MQMVSRSEALRRTLIWNRVNPPTGVDTGQSDYATEDAALATLNRSPERHGFSAETLTARKASLSTKQLKGPMKCQRKLNRRLAASGSNAHSRTRSEKGK